MKKAYEQPALEIIQFDITDIITHSLATGDGDNVIDWEDWWGDLSLDPNG